MVTLFLDITEIQAIFLGTVEPNTGQTGYLTNKDFKGWLFEAVNWLNYIYTDFGIGADNEDTRFRAPVCNFDGISELHETLRNSLDHPLLIDKTIISSFGFIQGDLLYFEIETEKGFEKS